MLFYSYFKTLKGKEVCTAWVQQMADSNSALYDPRSFSMQVTVELKNDLAITGIMHSVDQYLNIKLNNTRVVNEQKYPHMVSSLVEV